MIIVLTLSEILLYICFSMLIGALVLLLVPEGYRPQILIPKKLFYVATGIIPIAALFPVIRTTSIFSEDRDMWFIFKNVLLTFEVGQSWVFITLISVILIRVIITKNFKGNPVLLALALLLTMLMLLGYTRSSHAATITEWQGFLAHTFHFLAVTVWIGILFVASWFSKTKDNWLRFLKWFTPVAVVCLIIVSVAGYFTMSIDINSYDNPNASIFQEYQNSLIVNYGQALLFKHLFMISLVLFAIINGIIFRKRNNDASFNPLKWARLESIYALTIFGLTAFMGQSWPPHQIYSLIKSYGASPLYTTFTQSNLVNTIQSAEMQEVFNVSFSFGFMSYLLCILGVLFMAMTIIAAVKRSSVAMASSATLLMVLSFYFALMMAIQ
ncbi:hypothetical protein MUO14_03125 [Halobacillus shinanisalinarum]|uniref:Copper resistance protein CopD n=1 Tax=Halobacillus shinanisalinarum TaxID=2932258 RepID=A0ABY4H104_9BACI|nr:hypothetical protein [Halobacillus shinanisalinarum]UOQ93976.1 hypothetical protein MUO14_03125 [Halobacillus shinanisalinarum]